MCYIRGAPAAVVAGSNATATNSATTSAAAATAGLQHIRTGSDNDFDYHYNQIRLQHLQHLQQQQQQMLAMQKEQQQRNQDNMLQQQQQIEQMSSPISQLDLLSSDASFADLSDLSFEYALGSNNSWTPASTAPSAATFYHPSSQTIGPLATASTVDLSGWLDAIGLSNSINNNIINNNNHQNTSSTSSSIAAPVTAASAVLSLPTSSPQSMDSPPPLPLLNTATLCPDFLLMPSPSAISSSTSGDMFPAIMDKEAHFRVDSSPPLSMKSSSSSLTTTTDTISRKRKVSGEDDIVGGEAGEEYLERKPHMLAMQHQQKQQQMQQFQSDFMFNGSSVENTAAIHALSPISNNSSDFSHHSHAQSTTIATKQSSTSDNLDEATLRRVKNTEAARRSRARKTAKLETLEDEVKRLEADKNGLLLRLAVLENETKGSAFREAMLIKRVADLERLLTGMA